MRCRFKCRSAIKFAFMFLTVSAIWALFVNVHSTFQLDGLEEPQEKPEEESQKDGLPTIVMETLKRNRFLGK